MKFLSFWSSQALLNELPFPAIPKKWPSGSPTVPGGDNSCGPTLQMWRPPLVSHPADPQPILVSIILLLSSSTPHPQRQMTILPCPRLYQVENIGPHRMISRGYLEVGPNSWGAAWSILWEHPDASLNILPALPPQGLALGWGTWPSGRDLFPDPESVRRRPWRSLALGQCISAYV